MQNRKLLAGKFCDLEGKNKEIHNKGNHPTMAGNLPCRKEILPCLQGGEKNTGLKFGICLRFEYKSSLQALQFDFLQAVNPKQVKFLYHVFSDTTWLKNIYEASLQTRMQITMVKIAWNAQKFPEKLYFPILLYRAKFLEITKLLANFPEIRKIPENLHPCLKLCKIEGILLRQKCH